MTPHHTTTATPIPPTPPRSRRDVSAFDVIVAVILMLLVLRIGPTRYEVVRRMRRTLRDDD